MLYGSNNFLLLSIHTNSYGFLNSVMTTALTYKLHWPSPTTSPPTQPQKHELLVICRAPSTLQHTGSARVKHTHESGLGLQAPVDTTDPPLQVHWHAFCSVTVLSPRRQHTGVNTAGQTQVSGSTVEGSELDSGEGEEVGLGDAGGATVQRPCDKTFPPRHLHKHSFRMFITLPPRPLQHTVLRVRVHRQLDRHRPRYRT